MSLKIDNQKFQILFDKSAQSGVKISRLNENNQRLEITDQDKIIKILEKANQVSTKISKELGTPSSKLRPSYLRPIQPQSNIFKLD